jgi:2',3'-cyclic-nucleotide 2'-phosphodiesterase (5'-nucleotidase family)
LPGTEALSRLRVQLHRLHPNQIGFDVGTPGNHQFDEGLDELLRLLNGGPSDFPPGSTFEGQDFPLVWANVVDADTQEWCC